MKTIEELNLELKKVMIIKSDFERRQAALLWWEGLNEPERQLVRDKISTMLTHFREIWDNSILPMMESFYEFGNTLVQEWRDLLLRNPELATYLRKNQQDE